MTQREAVSAGKAAIMGTVVNTALNQGCNVPPEGMNWASCDEPEREPHPGVASQMLGGELLRFYVGGPKLCLPAGVILMQPKRGLRLACQVLPSEEGSVLEIPSALAESPYLTYGENDQGRQMALRFLIGGGNRPGEGFTVRVSQDADGQYLVLPTDERARPFIRFVDRHGMV